MNPRRSGSGEGLSGRFREEVLNVKLAELLSKRGLLTLPETIKKIAIGGERGARLPDITIGYLSGVRVIIEGRVGSSSSVKGSLSKDAKQRVEEGLSPVCIGVLYPAELRGVQFAELETRLSSARLQMQIHTEAGSGDWFEGNVENLADSLRRTYEAMVQERVVESAVEELGTAVEEAAEKFLAVKVAPERLRGALGIPEGESEEPEE